MQKFSNKLDKQLKKSKMFVGGESLEDCLMNS